MMRLHRFRVRPAQATSRARSGPRTFYLAALACLALVAGTGFTPDPPLYATDPALFGAIEEALTSGRADQVLAYAGRQVEIRILGRGTLYSKAQALYVLAEFLERYPPSRFAFSEYASSDDRRFAFGSYWVRGVDRPFHVYVNLRQRDGGWELRELRFELP